MLGSAVTILMYHSVGTAGDRWTISPEEFTFQLELLRRHGEFVPLRDAERHIRAGGSRKIAITFDDAFVDYLEQAHPILVRLSVPSTVFVPTGYMGGRNAWDAGRGYVSQKPILHADQIKALASDPLVDFGSHSIDHLSMGTLPAHEMRRQAVESRATLEDLLSRPVTMFSYPYGDYGDFTSETEHVVRSTGYTLAVTTRWGSRNRLRDLFRLRRLSFARGATARDISARVAGLYDVKDTRDWLRSLYRSARAHTNRSAPST